MENDLFATFVTILALGRSRSPRETRRALPSQRVSLVVAAYVITGAPVLGIPARALPSAAGSIAPAPEGAYLLKLTHVAACIARF